MRVFRSWTITIEACRLCQHQCVRKLLWDKLGSVDSRVQDRQRNEQIGFDLNSTIQLGQFFGKQARVSLPFFYGYSLGLINPEYDPFNPDIKLADYDDATRRERKKLGQDFNERKSFNFTNVRKEAKAGSKNHFWRISNWAASYAFSETCSEISILKKRPHKNMDRRFKL